MSKAPTTTPATSYVRDVAAQQLIEYAKTKAHEEPESVTTADGIPIPYNNASLTVGKIGPTLLQDHVLIDELAHFSRERIPERVVHAKGAGAFGYFEVTHDITHYCAAKIFSQIGKKTPMAVRFSQVFGELGYADTVRDVRGFALKFYTEDGNWDLVGNNTPIFFIRDAILFPSFIHILKRNPVTHLHDWDMFWDFMTSRPETIHQLLVFFSDRGIPASYRNMHGYGSNTFAMVAQDGTVNYCKFHYKTDQGIANFEDENQAVVTAGEDPDYLLRDLYNNIQAKNIPSWTMSVQIMSPEQAAHYKFDPFDVTKVWLHADFPLIPVGKFYLNRNPKNYFAEVEQLAFNVANLVPGIEPSPDRMLQGRLFNYADTHRYRLGINSSQLPVNSPYRMHTYYRDGRSTIDSQAGAPNYHPNSFQGPVSDTRARALEPLIPLVGSASRYDNGGEDNYTQGRLLYENVLKPEERGRLITNVVNYLTRANDSLQEKGVKMFSNINKDLGQRIRNGLNQRAQNAHADI